MNHVRSIIRTCLIEHFISLLLSQIHLCWASFAVFLESIMKLLGCTGASHETADATTPAPAPHPSRKRALFKLDTGTHREETRRSNLRFFPGTTCGESAFCSTMQRNTLMFHIHGSQEQY